LLTRVGWADAKIFPAKLVDSPTDEELGEKRSREPSHHGRSDALHLVGARAGGPLKGRDP